jgi:agmatinase
LINKLNVERRNLRLTTLLDFNPDENGLGTDGIFGLPFNQEESELILIPVPWEVTVSYKSGAASGPQAIRNASDQLDLYDALFPNGWQYGIYYSQEVFNLDAIKLRQSASQFIDALTNGYDLEPFKGILAEINSASELLNQWVYEQSKKYIQEGKLVGLIGGDHSTPYGYIKYLSERFPGFGILHLDAHADLRPQYEGFHYSHASIFHNVVNQLEGLGKLVQVGIRDMSNGEVELANNHPKIEMITDFAIKSELFKGKTWDSICDEILSKLPQFIYISFDIDVLEQYLAPGTGTPVPGGLTLDHITYLFSKIIDSNKKVIGFDLNEVAFDNNEWNGNVGARALYKLCLTILKTNFK